MTLAGSSGYSGPTIVNAGTLKLGSGLAGAISLAGSNEWTPTPAAANSNNFTISTGANVLVVEVTWRTGAGVQSPTSITYNGTNLTSAVTYGYGNNVTGAAIFYLSSTSSGFVTGASDPLVVNFPNAPSDLSIAAFSLDHVNVNELPSAGLANSTGTAGSGAAFSQTTIALPMTNIATGSWEAFASGYRQGTAAATTTTITNGTGTLLGPGGNLFNYVGANEVGAGGFVSNIQTSSLTVQEASTGASNTIWALVGAVFQPQAGVSGGSSVLPVGTALIVSSSGTFDLGGGSQTVAALSDAAPGQGGTVLNSNSTAASILTLAPAGGGSTTFSGLIAGGGSLGNLGLVMSGSGLQYLAGANTYTGGTQVTSGTLQLGNAAALGTGAVAANGGVLDLAGLSILAPSFSGLSGTVTTSVAQPVTLTVSQTGSTAFGGTLQNGAGVLALVFSGGSSGQLQPLRREHL